MSSNQKVMPVIHVLLRWLPVLAILALAWILDHAIPPFHRRFSPTDPTIAFPHRPRDTVPPYALFLISVVVPAVAIISISAWVRPGWKHFHEHALAFTAAFAYNAFATHIIKLTVGRHRPDWLDRCDPNPAEVAAAIQPGTITVVLFDASVCQPSISNSAFLDGMKSFPSGHSSYSFAGLTYLALYLHVMLRRIPEPYRSTYRPFVVLLPIVGALLVAISRVCDYRHHWQDVTVGAIMGIGFAWSWFWYSAMTQLRKPAVSDAVTSGSWNGFHPVRSASPSETVLAPANARPGAFVDGSQHSLRVLEEAR